MGLGMRLVTAAGPYYTELDQDGLCTEVGKYRDWPRNHLKKFQKMLVLIKDVE
jgi:hypothetical protein